YQPLRAALHEGRKQGILAELFFNFYEQDQALTLDLHHSAEFFSPARAQSLLDGLLRQLDRLAGGAGPAQASAHAPAPVAAPLASPSAPAPAVPDAHIAAWNRATEAPHDPAQRVEAWVERQAQATPEAPAVLTPGGTLS